jgi:hypothetical protein
VTIPPSARAHEDDRVQVISSSRAARPPLGAVVVGSAVGLFLVIGGLFLAWVAFATPVLSGLTPVTGRPGAAQLALGGVVWGVTLVAPPSFAIVGALRLGRVARALTTRPRTGAIGRVSAQLGDDYVAARDVRLPDGRVVRNVVLGPFGLAVISELPPPQATRHAGISWEIRGPNGRWHHLENPLERAARDAERVRRWFASTERDYVVKVYAAVVTTDTAVDRTATCAVVTTDQIPPWLASLPPTRAITPDRRAEITEALRTLV